MFMKLSLQRVHLTFSGIFTFKTVTGSSHLAPLSHNTSLRLFGVYLCPLFAQHHYSSAWATVDAAVHMSKSTYPI